MARHRVLPIRGSISLASRIGYRMALALLAGCGSNEPVPQKLSAPTVAPTPATQAKASAAPDKHRGESLYAQHCIACHGEKGDGKGVAATFLFPKPRDFRAGRFRLISTANSVPTVADLDQVLVRGMPGSAMISWAHLSPSDRRLLAEQVVKLRRDGARDLELALAEEEDETLSDDELKEAVDRVTTPGDVLEPPSATGATTEAIARGSALYKSKACNSCHGEKGKGDGQRKMVDAEGLPTRPRDLTLGIFKGSPAFEDVYRRIWLGMPGSPMPSSQQLTTAEVSDLVHFVLSMSDDASREASVLKRVGLTAKRVGVLPSGPFDKAWRKTAPQRLAMTPLWWRDDALTDLRVQAVHDGKSIAVRLVWNDAQADRNALRIESFKDAVAMELYRGPAEPFVGMGARDAAVDVWMWDADSSSAPTDIEDVNPRVVVDLYPLAEEASPSAEYDRPGTRTSSQADITLPALAAGNQIVPVGHGRSAASLEGAGPGSVTFRLPKSQIVRAQGEWRDGRWNVILTRALRAPAGKAGISLGAGERVSIAFAVWNGSQRDRDGQKLITIWQDLTLER